MSSAPPRRARTPAPPQDRSPYLLAPSKPDCTVGTRPLRHKRHRNLSGTCLSPNPGSRASNRRWCVLPGSRAAPGTYCGRVAQGSVSPGKEGRSLPQTIHTTNLPAVVSKKWEQGGTDSWLQMYLLSCTAQLGKPLCTQHPDFTQFPTRELYPKGILVYMGPKHP